MKSQEKDKIYITIPDMERLRLLLQAETACGGANSQNLRSLEDELDRAEVVEIDDIPTDLVRMRSWVRLRDLETEEEMFFQLVYPPNADLDSAKISILAPIGTAVLGYRAGDVVEWQVPRGRKRFRIEEVVLVQ
jgi:regulator of nucleoside diphosphate kinase